MQFFCREILVAFSATFSAENNLSFFDHTFLILYQGLPGVRGNRGPVGARGEMVSSKM